MRTNPLAAGRAATRENGERMSTDVSNAPEVNGGEWLMSIDADPELFDTELVVATAIVVDGTVDPGPEDAETVQDAVEELIAHEYLDVAFSVDWSPEHTEHSLRLRYPFGHTDLSGFTWPAEL
jgi:hypothetical protein